MKHNIFFYFIFLAVTMLTACNDILDEAPDNRTDIDDSKKVNLLLAAGYPQGSPAVIMELSGDNLVDNNVVVPATHKNGYSLYHDEAYAWEDIRNYSTGDVDTPYQIWEAYYQSIAVCNHAIDAMKRLSADPKNDPTLSPMWGEAHVLRGYLHFMLATVFAEAYKDETQSQNDMCIPYVTVPETTVNVDYSKPEFRKSVAETYRLIENDFLEGIDLIDDAQYKVPAYRFNKNAANAFAARFYLAKRDYEKVVEYADRALGANASAMLRKWSAISSNTINTLLNSYNDETAACNFMIQSTYSLFDRMLSACRYAVNTGNKDYDVPATKDMLIEGGGPCWNSRLPAFDGKVYRWNAGSEFGSWLGYVYEYFEYTDKIAGIGYVHMLYHPFTAEETLLCRAEANLYLGNKQSVIDDLSAWAVSKQCPDPMTIDRITSFYSRSAKKDFLSDIHPTEMSSEFTAFAPASEEYYMLQCILHLRRIDTQFEGLRWFDIKRYGITVYHAYRGPLEDDVHQDWLTWNDKRRVLQIPNNVITAGFPAIDRINNTVDQQSCEVGQTAIQVK